MNKNEDFLKRKTRKKLEKIKADGEGIDHITDDKSRPKWGKRAAIADYNEKVLSVIEECDKERKEVNKKIDERGDEEIIRAVANRPKGRLFFSIENERYEEIDWGKK